MSKRRRPKPYVVLDVSDPETRKEMEGILQVEFAQASKLQVTPYDVPEEITAVCEWCKGDVQVLLEVELANKDIGEVFLFIGKGSPFIGYHAPLSELSWDLDIKYCPNCGRKLNNE